MVVTDACRHGRSQVDCLAAEAGQLVAEAAEPRQDRPPARYIHQQFLQSSAAIIGGARRTSRHSVGFVLAREYRSTGILW